MKSRFKPGWYDSEQKNLRGQRKRSKREKPTDKALGFWINKTRVQLKIMRGRSENEKKFSRCSANAARHSEEE